MARAALSAPRLAWVAAGVATSLALVSAWSSGGQTWRRLNADQGIYSAYSASQRVHAPIDAAGFRGDLFDFFSSYVRDGDRIYYQVPRSAYGTLDLHDTVAALGRFYLLPAVQVTDLRDATVVISYNADPGRLRLHFLFQRQNGPRIFISRVAFP